MYKLWCFILVLELLQGCNTQPNPRSSKVSQPAAIKQKEVSLLPYQGFDTSLIPYIQQAVAKFYHCSISILPTQPLPSFAYYQSRNRYKADSLLVYQQKMAGKRIIVGLTHQDISTSHDNHPDWGVFGLGYCPGQACVISTWRLVTNSKAQLQERLQKVVLHELGHNFGLPHCTSNEPSCLMNDAKGTMAQVDRERFWLCNACKQRLP
jgi:archaemetzincin